jgi:hypothetical protein
MCNEPICRCGFDSCLNGGFFSGAACSCICSSQFTGTRCENLVSTTASTSTAQRCAFQLPCQNGARFNTNTCKCECNKILLI